MTLFSQTSILGCLLVTFSFSQEAFGHGYVSSPRSRQWVAEQDGRYSGGASTLPKKEDCAHCANTKAADGFCGIVKDRDYDHPKDAAGNPLQPSAQAIYTEGQIIEVDVTFSTNHQGHYVLFGCPDFFNPTRSCFDQYPLEFMEDVSVETFGTSQNAPKDGNYPERGYVNPFDMKTRMKFKLPPGLTGDLVLLQWHWVTGNSCRSVGYEDYSWPSGWEPDGMSPCPTYENLSPIGAGNPEQFWSCSEVRINEGGPTPPSPATSSPTKAPVSTTVTSSPASSQVITLSPTVEIASSPTPAPIQSTPSGNGCCSQNYKDCVNNVNWCGTTEAECSGCGQNWLPNGAGQNCMARWADCTNNRNGCCDGLSCKGNQSYGQCLV